MKAINIAPYIDELLIFDDPEYCCEEFIVNLDFKLMNKCKYLSIKGECLKFETSRKDRYLRFTSKRKFEKCDQCKKAYQMATANK